MVRARRRLAHSSRAWWAVAGAYLAAGDLEKSEAVFTRALGIATTLDDEYGLALLHGELAVVALLQGRDQEAEEGFRYSIVHSLPLGELLQVVLCVEAIAVVRARSGAARVAARLLGAAEAQRDRMGTPRTGVHRLWVDPADVLIRAQLGGPAADESMRGGHALSLEEAIAEAITRCS